MEGTRREHPTTGQQAPEFSLPTVFGEQRSLGEYRSRGAVLLAFHRGIW
jgi:peroxiredoxin